ncbi:formylglycine-generating enzyme family protein [candidate division KSB1 bacterium]|nr:formylglycine-generating enzyme family protein [candidate division KSB1 bacterium]
MKFNSIFLIILGLLGSNSFTIAQNLAPEVTKVHAAQRANTQFVDITFEVTAPHADLLYIMLQASADSGRTFNVPVVHLSDSVGYGIVPNGQKRIVWDAGQDYPEHQGDDFQIKVVAINRPVGKMVYVPTDTFRMGNKKELIDFQPEHVVKVSAFYISATEITNIQYKRFCDATGHRYPVTEEAPNYFKNNPDYPVVDITWSDALAYCNWFSEINGYTPCYNLVTGACDTSKNGCRLPTEAEMERSARSDSFQVTYPWGNEVGLENCNYQVYNGPLVARMAPFENDRGPLPVASFAPTGFGLYDIAGNVSEWCQDWYDSDYYGVSPAKDPLGPTTGAERVLRGGDWRRAGDYLRVFHRDRKQPESTINGYYRGFRIVRRAR